MVVRPAHGGPIASALAGPLGSLLLDCLLGIRLWSYVLRFPNIRDDA